MRSVSPSPLQRPIKYGTFIFRGIFSGSAGRMSWSTIGPYAPLPNSVDSALLKTLRGFIHVIIGFIM